MQKNRENDIPSNSTQFLLDSSLPLSGNLSFPELYRLRQEQAEKPVKWQDWRNSNGLLWDDFESKKQHNYWPLENMYDFISQINWVGYHDICMYHAPVDVERILTPTERQKGFTFIYPGYGIRNGSGIGEEFFFCNYIF